MMHFIARDLGRSGEAWLDGWRGRLDRDLDLLVVFDAYCASR